MAGVFAELRAAAGVDFLPTLFAADHVHGEAFAVVIIAIEDVVDPPKLLLAPAPTPTQLGLARLERIEFFPHRG